VRHAYVKLEKTGEVCIRWWVDTAVGVATRTMIHVRPGERAFGLPYDSWFRLAGGFVDLDDLDRDERDAAAASN
jgi:hypothetical protein